MKIKTNIKKIVKIVQNSLILAVGFAFLVIAQTFAANTPTFSQTINSGSLSVDIVDSGGNSVTSPSVTFGALTYSFSTQIAYGTLASSNQRIRVYNPTSNGTWAVNLAASSPTATWTDSSLHYDFNDANGSGYTDGADDDSYGGQMTVDPDTNGTISGVSGCSTSNISKGSSDSFVEGSNNSIDIMTASSPGAATYCRWDYVSSDTNVSQKIPAGQQAGSYSINMALTIS